MKSERKTNAHIEKPVSLLIMVFIAFSFGAKTRKKRYLYGSFLILYDTTTFITMSSRQGDGFRRHLEYVFSISFI